MRGRRVSEQLRHEKVKARLLHIDKDGSEVEAYRFQNAHNAMREGANMARLSNANAGTR